jgi:RNA-binding protein with serine-rich domain 1
MEDYDARYSSDDSRSSSPEAETKNPETITEQPTNDLNATVDNRFVVEVRGLSRSVNAEHLKEIFGAYGKILKAEHAFCPFRKMLTGFGLINFEDASGVEKSIDYLDSTQLDGKFIFVKKYDGRDLFAKARRNHDEKKKNEALDNRLAVTIQLPKQEDLRKRIESKKVIETNVAFPGITRTVVKIDNPTQEKKDTIRIKSPDRRLSVEPPPTEKKKASPPRNRRSPERKRSRSPERKREPERVEIKSSRNERSQSPRVETKKPENIKKAPISRSSSRSPARNPDRRDRRSPDRRDGYNRRDVSDRQSFRQEDRRRSRSPDRRAPIGRRDSRSPGRRGGYAGRRSPDRREFQGDRRPPFRQDERRRSRSPDRRAPIGRRDSRSPVDRRNRSLSSSSSISPPKRRRSPSPEDARRNKK